MTLIGLEQSNRLRTINAAGRRIELARKALSDKRLDKRERQYLTLRIQNPELSLAELGDLAGVSKDVFAGVIRRATDRVSS